MLRIEHIWKTFNVGTVNERPMITAASPITIAPRPALTSAKPWYWAYRPLEKATMPLEITRPRILLISVLIPCARDIFALHPVARMEITYKVLDLADLTVDGTMATGGAVCVMLMLNGHSAGFSLLVAGKPTDHTDPLRLTGSLFLP